LAEPTGGSPVRAPAHAGFVLVNLAGGSFRVALDKELPMVDQGLGVGCVKGKGREQARVGGAPCFSSCHLVNSLFLSDVDSRSSTEAARAWLVFISPERPGPLEQGPVDHTKKSTGFVGRCTSMFDAFLLGHPSHSLSSSSMRCADTSNQACQWNRPIWTPHCGKLSADQRCTIEGLLSRRTKRHPCRTLRPIDLWDC
jgi:hypothetical protein